MILEVVMLAPLRPASYNNRAQALRLAGRPLEAVDDLNKAIELSQGKGQAGSAALCQRGVLYRKVLSSYCSEHQQILSRKHVQEPEVSPSKPVHKIAI